MARGLSDDAKAAAAVQAGRRTIARGERPLYRVRPAQDGGWTAEGCPWLSIDAGDRRGALAAARAVIAAWLEVDPEAFDIEAS